jgi:hypothetical protein
MYTKCTNLILDLSLDKSILCSGSSHLHKVICAVIIKYILNCLLQLINVVKS